MGSSRLRFQKTSTDRQPFQLDDPLHSLSNALNAREWRGKEPRSCRVTKIQGQLRPGAATLLDVEVTYRPKGTISYTGHTKYDGWTAMVLDRQADGTLLDGKGQPLKDGDAPVYRPTEVYPDVDFNDIDFGVFIDELEFTGTTKEKIGDVMEEITASGRVSMSLKSRFMAPRRNRPYKKIILTSQPTSSWADGFGTRILNLCMSTPHLEFVLMEHIANLMCEFIEGKASLKATWNDDVCFVSLSEALVDCSPNEDGHPSWFNMLHCYTPIGFLDDLAKRLMALYELHVSVVDGKECGLVLRQELDRKTSNRS